MVEIWKPIIGYESLYDISNLGNIKSYRHKKEGRLLKVNNLPRYPQIQLWRNNKHKNYTVHRLVALHFLENPLCYAEVNHKDRNIKNFDVSNLEWCNKFQNMEHSHAKNYKLIAPNGESIEIFNLSKFCRDNKLNIGNLHAVILGKRNEHKGYKRWI